MKFKIIKSELKEYKNWYNIKKCDFVFTNIYFKSLKWTLKYNLLIYFVTNIKTLKQVLCTND